MKIGIIGCGVIAVGAHIPAYQALGHEVVALADSAPGRATRFAMQFGIESAYEDYHELLARDDIDAVSVCVPTFLHEQVAVDALEAGKHLYLEKPPALDEKGIRHVYETAEKTGKILFVGSNSLYQPRFQIAKRMVDEGKLGEVYAVRLNRAQKRDIPNGWMKIRKYTRGFAITEGVTHNLDQTLYLLGSPEPESVTCLTYNKFASYAPLTYGYPMDAVESGSWNGEPKETEDGVFALVRFKNGCGFLIESFRACNAEECYNLNLMGVDGGLKINMRPSAGEKPLGLTYYHEPSRGVMAETVLDYKNPSMSHLDAITHFTDCVEKGIHTESDGRRAILIMRIIDAMFDSAEQNGRQIILK